MKINQKSVNQPLSDGHTICVMGCPTFLWHKAPPVFVGWFAGCTWRNNNKCWT